MKSLIPIIACLIASTAIAADKYVPSPLRYELLTERIDEHDQQICDLDERLRSLEQELQRGLSSGKAIPERAQEAANETVVRIVIDGSKTPSASTTVGPTAQRDFDGAVIVPGSIRTVSTASAPRTVTARTATGRRLKTTDELKRDIARNRTDRVYATIKPNTRAWAITHLVNDHGYSRSQVGSLSFADAWMLHNLAHGPKISPYTSGSTTLVAQKVETFVPTPRKPAPTPAPPQTFHSGCPNGRCPIAGNANAGGWYLGKNLKKWRSK